MSVVIRQATAADRNFIITAIVEAEKSGGARPSYCVIFGIDEQQLRALLGSILDEDIEGQELHTGSFLIAEVDGTPAAASSGWIEKAEGLSANMIKSNLFMYLMNRDLMLAAMPAMKTVAELNIEREERALQVECVYTVPGYRGRGLTALLIDEHIKRKREDGAALDSVQIILMDNNDMARKAYERAGFAVTRRKETTNSDILKLLPGNAKIMMERKLRQQ